MRIIIFILIILFSINFVHGYDNKTWKNEVKISQGNCKGYWGYYKPHTNTIYLCFHQHDRITEAEKKRTIDHEYAHALFIHLTNTEKYVWFNLHYDSNIRGDYVSDYAMKGAFNWDKWRQDWWEDFAETIAYTQNEVYECETNLCEDKISFAKKIIKKYY